MDGSYRRSGTAGNSVIIFVLEQGSRAKPAAPARLMAHQTKTIVGLSFVVLLASSAYSAASELPPPLRSETAHDFHVSYGRMAVENNLFVFNIRFFKDDLQQGLQAHTGNSDFFLDVSPRTDSLFTAYFNSHFTLRVSDKVLPGSIIGSGEDFEAKQDIWWYTLEFVADETIESFQLKNVLLLEEFDDQKNIVKVQHFPSEKTFAYYFDEDDQVFEITL